LQKEVFDEMKSLGIMFIVVLIAFKIAFFKENFIILLRNVLSLFWLFALPGYFMLLYWKNKLDFLERFIIGTSLSAATIGIVSYYFGLLGLNINYHFVLIPLLLIILGFVFSLKKKDI
jgi:uncharacterized membrane protein